MEKREILKAQIKAYLTLARTLKSRSYLKRAKETFQLLVKHV